MARSGLISEDLLRGVFHGKDKIVVSVVGEGDDRKLSFETSSKIVEEPPMAELAAAG